MPPWYSVSLPVSKEYRKQVRRNGKRVVKIRARGNIMPPSGARLSLALCSGGCAQRRYTRGYSRSAASKRLLVLGLACFATSSSNHRRSPSLSLVKPRDLGKVVCAGSIRSHAFVPSHAPRFRDLACSVSALGLSFAGTRLLPPLTKREEIKHACTQ